MGTTHYWMRPKELDAADYKEAIRDIQIAFEKIKEERPQLRLAGWDGKNKALISNKNCRFNGEGVEDAHETFDIPQNKYLTPEDRPDENGLYHDSCKTARKPYDIAVQISLLIFKHHFGPEFEVSSDSDIEEWADAMEICTKALGYGRGFRFDKG